MRRRTKRVVTTSVSLFPFLAVLICTFGVLIILLVIVVKAADQQSSETRNVEQDRHEQSIKQLNDEIELQGLQLDAIREVRPDLVKQLQDARHRRAHLQTDIDQLSDDAELLNNEIVMVSSKVSLESAEQLLVDAQQLEQELAKAKRRLQKNRQTLGASRPTKYSVVPHEGPNGTVRRPIYIECLSDRFVIQPYGISLNRSDFVQPIVANNPLDAALVAVREYFLKNKLSEVGETPYPLLIVRPEGAGSYGVARHAIRSWDEEFGYELISGDKELDFGEVDPQLKQKLELAVEAAKQRQQTYVTRKFLNRGAATNGERSGGGLYASRQFGGFVAPGGRIKQTNDATGMRSKNNLESNRMSPASAAASGDSISEANRSADIAVDGVQSQGRSIAEHRGTGWALPSKAEGAIAYRRPIKVYVARDEIVVEADSRSNKRVRIAVVEGPAQAVEALVEAVWNRIETWGVAGVNGYWKPELNVNVLPGGEDRYLQLRRLLDNSGIDVMEERR